MRIPDEMSDCVEETVSGDSIPDEPLTYSISYRCVHCYGSFSTLDTYRDHYVVEHLGIVAQKSSTEVSNAVADVPSSEDDAPQPAPVAPRSFCKRCRSRILSSSDDEEIVGQRPRKANRLQRLDSDEGCAVDDFQNTKEQLNDKGVSSTLPKDAVPVIVADVPSTSTAISTSTESSLEHSTEASSSNGRGAVVDRNADVPSAGNSAPSEECLEIVKDLLKDANALSRPQKVLILNFVSGYRVNPSPGKGPILTIPLREKMDTVIRDDGSEQCVIRRSCIKLNYDTGQWEKIENTKQMHCTS